MLLLLRPPSLYNTSNFTLSLSEHALNCIAGLFLHTPTHDTHNMSCMFNAKASLSNQLPEDWQQWAGPELKPDIIHFHPAVILHKRRAQAEVVPFKEVLSVQESSINLSFEISLTVITIQLLAHIKVDKLPLKGHIFYVKCLNLCVTLRQIAEHIQNSFRSFSLIFLTLSNRFTLLIWCDMNMIVGGASDSLSPSTVKPLTTKYVSKTTFSCCECQQIW